MVLRKVFNQQKCILLENRNIFCFLASGCLSPSVLPHVSCFFPRFTRRFGTIKAKWNQMTQKVDSWLVFSFALPGFAFLVIFWALGLTKVPFGDFFPRLRLLDPSLLRFHFLWGMSTFLLANVFGKVSDHLIFTKQLLKKNVRRIKNVYDLYIQDPQVCKTDLKAVYWFSCNGFFSYKPVYLAICFLYLMSLMV